VKQASENWIKSVAVEGREASTLAQYRQHAKHINDRIGNMKLANLTTPQLNMFRDDLLTAMSRAMGRKVMSSLKSLLKDAQRRGTVAQNVALAVKRIDKDKRSEQKLKIGIDIPTADEIKAILAAAGPRVRPLLHAAIFTGLRSSELRGLRWSETRRAPRAPARRPLRRHRQAQIGVRLSHRPAWSDVAQRAARVEAGVPQGRV
jgi:integrase